MKSISHVKFNLLLITILLFNCSAEDNDQKDVSENYGTITAEITGIVSELNSWLPIQINDDNTITINAINCDRPASITLTFTDEIGVYTYEEGRLNGDLIADGPFFPCQGSWNNSSSNFYEITTGTLHVLNSDSDIVMGTFSFTCTKYDGDVRAVTNGVFNIKK